MGRKIEALKWAATHRPNWKGANRHEITDPPLKHSDAGSLYLYGHLWFVLAIVIGVLTSGLFAFGIMLVGWFWFMRAYWKLRNEWIDEHYEIIKRPIDVTSAVEGYIRSKENPKSDKLELEPRFEPEITKDRWKPKNEPREV